MKNIRTQIGIDIIRVVINSPNIVMFVCIQKERGQRQVTPPSKSLSEQLSGQLNFIIAQVG
jgi:hypothetical protein